MQQHFPMLKQLATQVVPPEVRQLQDSFAGHQERLQQLQQAWLSIFCDLLRWVLIPWNVKVALHLVQGNFLPFL